MTTTLTATFDGKALIPAGEVKVTMPCLFRGGDYTNVQMRELLRAVLTNVADLSELGMFVVADFRHIRKRRLPF